ncbi:MAG: Crp/Fnr family transcriptional regulator, partial [Anaerolineae bacterium]
MQSDVDILASARLFEALPRPAVERLAERSQHRHFGAGERVFDEGDPGAALYVVAEGEIRIDIASPAGEHVTLVFLGPGEAFGELALLDDAPRSAEAVATEASTLLSLYRKDFYSILEDEPEAVRALLGTLAGYVRNTNQRLADAAFLDVPGRMAKALKTLADRYGKQTPDGILLDHELTPS